MRKYSFKFFLPSLFVLLITHVIKPFRTIGGVVFSQFFLKFVHQVGGIGQNGLVHVLYIQSCIF